MPFRRGDEGTRPELLDQHHQVLGRIVEHGSNGMAALEDLALHRRPPAAGVEPVAQPVADDPEVPGEGALLLQDLDVADGHPWRASGSLVIAPASRAGAAGLSLSRSRISSSRTS